MNVTQVIAMVIDAGSVGGAVKIIAQLTRIAVAIEGLVEWKKETDARLDSHQSRLDKGGL